MRRLQRPFVALLIAHLLVAGFAGSLHVHTDGDCSHGHCSNDESPKLAEKPACPCGHDHGSSPAEAETPADEHEHPPTSPHDHDHCSLCQFLATAWLPTAVVEFDASSEAVEFLPAADAGAPELEPAPRRLPRGPPVA